MQSSIGSLGKVASGLTLASTFLLSSIVGLSGAFAANEGLVLRETGTSVLENADGLLAQTAPDATILNFGTADYSVRVFREGGALKMNVFDASQDLLRVNALPTTFTIRNGRGAYITTGDYSGRQATYIAEVYTNRTAALIIVDGANSVIANQPSGNPVAVFAVPESDLQQVRQDTVLNFKTSSYAVRVFQRDGQRFMNVYNEFTAQSELNGTAASLAEPVFPYENAVSYVSSGDRNGQPVRYFARIDGSGRTFLEIFNVNGQRLFQEPGVGEVLVNIPPEDLPTGVDDIDRVDDAYVAAVFGDQDTLDDVKQLFPEAFMDSSRQGDFINAGAYASQDEATLRVLELRARGFQNARVVFRDVRYR
ncbi:MAG: hypothetical protein AAF283_09550 [Cyanobacteria bacterium P01_A01_bin.70]